MEVLLTPPLTPSSDVLVLPNPQMHLPRANYILDGIAMRMTF